MTEISPCADEAEEQASLDVYNAVWSHDAVSMDEVRSFKTTVTAYVDYLARIDGEPVGSAVGVIQPQRPDHVFVLAGVLPEQRGRGIGSAFYKALSEWTAERGLTELEVALADDDPESLGFVQKRGFTEVRREPGLVLDLTELDPPPVEPPEGVEILTWAERPDLARGIYEVALESLADIPGDEDDVQEPFEDWLAHDMQGSGDLPEATFVALAGDEVIGYAKFSLTAAQPVTAHHDLTGVKRSWRGRGVARALKATQIRWAKENGYEELRTRNEQRNEPIRRLNAHFGYSPAPGRIYLRGPVKTSTA
ncbi:MAG: GNAT family N-acetyltransferase [Gaiellaceae bacterium]